MRLRLESNLAGDAGRTGVDVGESGGVTRSCEDGAPSTLTHESLIALDYLPVPDALQGLVTTFYHFRCDEYVIRDVQPAAVGHLIVFLRGEGRMIFADGRADRSHPVSVLTPSRAAAEIEVAGPFHCVGAALSPGGWASFTGLHAGEWSDRLLPATEIFGEAIGDLGERLVADYARGVPGEALCTQLADFLAPRARPLDSKHCTFIRCVADWLGTSLDPETGALYAASAYSPRQSQRLTERYFGLPPRELKRKYRALRAATLFGMPEASEEDIAATIDLFCDQSHMIRELRHFIGRTPKRLADEDDTILSTLLDIRNFREIAPQVAAMPDHPTANDSQ